MKRSIVIAIASLACAAAFGAVAWQCQRTAFRNLPPGVQGFNNVRWLPLGASPGDRSDRWMWETAFVLEMEDGAHVVPVMRTRKPLADGMGSRVVLLDPIWRTGNSPFTHIPEDERIAAAHLLIRASRHTPTRGHILSEYDVWRVLKLSRAESVESDRILVPPLESLPPLDSLPEGEHWLSLLEAATAWYRENQDR